MLSHSILTFASLGFSFDVDAFATDANGETMPSAAVTWATSDAAVATVSSTGLVTSIADGTAMITATLDLASATASVTVNNDVWASISAGNYHTVGITKSGAAYAWGYNYYGQLGDGTTHNRGTPVLVSGGHTWASIGVGNQHTVGITTGGAAYAWGDNPYGQLGDGTTTDRSTPTLVSGGHTWASISAGYGGFYTVGITTGGAAYAWGRNNHGQLGNRTTTDRLTPTLVSGGYTWASISAGESHTVGITTSEAAYAWGRNGKHLGDGAVRPDLTDPFAPRLTPVPVMGGYTWASIAAGTYYTMGITTSGEAYAWGSNSILRLGTGDNTSGTIHTTPVLVSPHP